MQTSQALLGTGLQNVKLLNMCMFGIVFMLLTIPVFATDYSATGKVVRIKIHDPQIVASNVDWFNVDGFDRAGSCLVQGGYVAVTLRSNSDSAKRMLSTVLSAQMTGKNITVSVNDAYKNQYGNCYLVSLTVD